jgi:hypothetical protein
MCAQLDTSAVLSGVTTMAQHMKKLAKSSHTGSDELHFYDIGSESGGEPLSHIRVVHLQEWSDLVGEIEAEDMEKYNVVAHDVCVYGYDGQRDPETGVVGIGESVYSSLRSCGYKLISVGLDVHQIVQEYDGEVIAQGALTDPQVALCITEAMYGYGAGDRAYDESGNNARHLLQHARRA